MPIESRTVQPVTEYAPGAAGRLARARRAAWQSVATIAKNHGDRAAAVIASMRADDWREAARGKFNMMRAQQSGQWQTPRPENPLKVHMGRAYYVDSFDVLGWRDLGTAEEVSRREGSRAVEHSGWYCDSDNRETVSGHVLQLPARNGVPQYVAAVAWSDRDGVTVWPARTYDSPLEAARSADGEAEKIGESERDYDSAWSAGSYFASLGEEIAAARAKALAILAERKAVRGIEAPNLCAAIRERLESILDDIREARATRGKLANGDAEGLMFWPGDATLRAAFNEGAGRTVLA